jgi:phosphoribosylanthranilate isomerase
MARRIIRRMPPGVVRVGVFVDPEPLWAKKLLQELELDRIQVHGTTPIASLVQAVGRMRVIRALAVPLGAKLPEKRPCPQAGYILLDAHHPQKTGGTGETANWTYARALAQQKPNLILAGGLHAGNVAAAIRRVRPGMVDASSCLEKSLGRKDHAKVRAFIRAAKAE